LSSSSNSSKCAALESKVKISIIHDDHGIVSTKLKDGTAESFMNFS
jgi:hypothetical protein